MKTESMPIFSESVHWRKTQDVLPPRQINILGAFDDDGDGNRWIRVCYLDLGGNWFELHDAHSPSLQLWSLIHAPTLWAFWPEGPTRCE